MNSPERHVSPPTAKQQGRVIVAGSINMDVVVAAPRFPVPGETIAGIAVAFHPGGKGANQAVAAAKLGARTFLIGRVGRDAFGGQLRTFLGRQGVDIRHVQEVDGSTGTAVITTVDARNTIIVVPGANAALEPADATAEIIQPGDILLGQFETPRTTTQQFFHYGKQAGATTILNPSPADHIDPALLDHTDIIVLNETELASLCGMALTETSADSEIIASAQSLRGRRKTQVICVTLGPRGIIALADEVTIIVPGRRVAAVDSTGAGDCFTGALAASLASGCDLTAALHYANDAAAISVQRSGAGPSMPSAADIKALYEGASDHAA
jgi:ribokinase